MGFGWLFLGYIVSFVLYSVAKLLSAGFAAHLTGYLLMLRGLWELRRYRKEFLLPLGGVAVLFPITVYEALEELGGTFLWRLPFVTPEVTAVVDWVNFAVVLFLHFGVYYAIACLAGEVDLPKTVRGAVFVGSIGVLYAVLYVIFRLPALGPAAARFSIPLTVYLLFWRICDICLLISCCKNICPEGDEEVAPRKYRWEFLNRTGARFSENFRRAADSARAAREETLRRRQNRRKRK